MWLERLSRDHNRVDFTCGRDELDEWFQQTARQAADVAESSTTYVLTDDGSTVLGFFAISVHVVAVEEVPANLVGKHPAHLGVSAILLGRMAVAKDHQGQRLGERLMRSVIDQVLAIRERVAVRLLVVDAIDEDAAGFYEQYGFVRWPTDQLRLFARAVDLARTFGLE
ncbi:MAG: GNAT family N-acetyltransferase [Nitriliruptor sp.]|uniref:GNAT family N-acetyltransferase n=1 Tax=Nitriliruptor sp. TaxID=2448056 RepID=UPI0034A0A4C2